MIGASGAEGLPERYKVQFTAPEEYVRLLEQAKALLSHANARLFFEELQLRAMRALVAELSKKKFATVDSPAAARTRRTKLQDREGEADEGGPPSLERKRARGPQPRERRRDELKKGSAPEPGGCPRDEPTNARRAELAEGPRDEPMNALHAGSREGQRGEPMNVLHPRRRGRYIPAGVRRAVFERDGQRCSFVAATGERCVETHRLEFHHLEPFARGGAHTVANVALRCAAHNALAAEEDFGREFMESRVCASLAEGRFE